ncbi:MAG: Rrf2 family transcriptional regulator [Acaryochloris sp. CRU_2_0]|nr:Rrf2 family transcriptional regulator [Acaryochloris sp. CRU_2_0]
MKLTTRGHYSVKALLDLSLQPDYGPASVNTIAERQALPAPYLEKLLIEMRQAGLVRSLRGSKGGYQLARSPVHISLGQILEAVGETIEPWAETPTSNQPAADWVTLTLWKRLHQKLQESLYNISLEDLYFDARSWQATQGAETSLWSRMALNLGRFKPSLGFNWG